MDGEMVHDHLFISSFVMQLQLKDFPFLLAFTCTYKIFSRQILIETDNDDKERHFIWQLLSNNLVSHSTF